MITLLSQQSFKRMPWKNGLGVTQEIAIQPGAADFVWRLSTARVERNSEFSVYPNHKRYLVVVEGEGLRLFHEGRPPVELRQGEVHSFAGAWKSRAELLGGPIRDLNVWTLNDLPSSALEVWGARKGSQSLSGKLAFLYALKGAFEVRQADQKLQARQGDAVRIETSEPFDLHCEGALAVFSPG